MLCRTQNKVLKDSIVYPSKNSPYNGDIDMCLRRATADWHEVIGAMLKRDDRQQQTAVLMTSDGRAIGQPFHTGAIAPVDVPDPEPNEPEQEP